MYIDPIIAKSIKDAADIEKVVRGFVDLKQKGSSLVGDCPTCGSKNKLSVSTEKNIANCFKCFDKALGPIDFLTVIKGMSFPEALQYLADLYHIPIEQHPEPPRGPKQTRKKKASFRDQQLKESGIDLHGDKVKVPTPDGHIEKHVFESGTVNERFDKVKGDDLIINYFDLEGKPVKFFPKNKKGTLTNTAKDYYRIRYASPESHPNRQGKPTKYRSPYGSSPRVFIPEIIRRKYELGSHVKTLFVTEGEKKAWKASVEGILTIGLSGIHNLANNGEFPKELELIILKCNVEKVVFLVDNDCFDLGKDLVAKTDYRPRSFSKAVENFKDYFRSLSGRSIFLEIFFAHINTDLQDKGIDDLLVGQAAGKAPDIIKKLNEQLELPMFKGDFISGHKITQWSSYKVRSLWGLSSKEEFYNKHKSKLKDVPEWTFRGNRYRVEDHEVVLAEPLTTSEHFWTVTKVKGDNLRYSFRYTGLLEFLRNRGFWRLSLDQNTGEFLFVREQDRILEEVRHDQIRDFVVDFCESVGYDEVREMLYRGGRKFIGPESLSHLKYLTLNVVQNTDGLQYMIFRNQSIQVTKDRCEPIDPKSIDGHIWKKQIKQFDLNLTPPLFDVAQVDKSTLNGQAGDAKRYFLIQWEQAGYKCDFAQFLMNTSNFFHDIDRNVENLNYEHRVYCHTHFLSKITALGYFLHRYRDSSVEKAVVAMDAKQGEIGDSNGRSGKSLFGEALSQLLNTVYINGKKDRLHEDRFIWEEVNERSEAIFIDDVRSNFDFEFFFPSITGVFQVEGKGVKKRSLDRQQTPKIYITTNHTIKGDGPSFTDRLFILGFSDYYNGEYSPADDFNARFWDDWDGKQYNYFYNLAIFSLQVYFKYGLVEAPQEKLISRKLQADIGDSFIDWADSFFSDPSNLNTNHEKLFIYNGESQEPSGLPFDQTNSSKAFLQMFPDQRKYVNVRRFKKKLKKWAELRGLEFNPLNKGQDIKSNGIEYIHLAGNLVIDENH